MDCPPKIVAAVERWPLVEVSTVFLSDGEDFEVNPKPKPRLLLSKTFFSEVLFLPTFSENEKNILKRHANY